MNNPGVLEKSLQIKRMHGHLIQYYQGLTNHVLLIVYQKKLLTFAPCSVCILPSDNVMAAVLNIEHEQLLSSSNQTAASTEEGPTETGEVGSLNGNPSSSASASSETSSVGNINHATVVETVHRVVQEVQSRDFYEIE